MKILHLSDLHLKPSKKHQNYLHTQNLFTEIQNNFSPDSTKIIISGDLGDGRKINKEYAHLKYLIHTHLAAFDIMICPGNHDYGGYGSLQRKNKNLPAEYKTVLLGLPNIVSKPLTNDDFPTCNAFDVEIGDDDGNQTCKIYCIGLNSMEAEVKRIFTRFGAHGTIGCDQLRRLHDIITAIEKRREPENGNERSKIIVYLHHHPFYHVPFMILKDEKVFHNVIKNRIDVLLFGHHHRENDFSGHRTSLSYGQIVYCSGKSTDCHEKKCYTFNYIEIVEKRNRCKLAIKAHIF